MIRRLMLVAWCGCGLFMIASPLAAQDSWRTMIMELNGKRAIPWKMLVDTQRVVRNQDGSFMVFLRWSGSVDSLNEPRTDRVERRQMNCGLKQTRQVDLQRVQVRDARDADVTIVPLADSVWSAFDADGLYGEFFGSVCSWLAKRRAGLP